MLLDILIWALYLGSCAWVFFDARAIVKQTQYKEIADKISPTLWLIGVLGLWIICFPLYLVKRAGYMQQDFSFKSRGTVIGLAVVAVFVLHGVLTYTGDIKLSASDLQATVEQHILETWKKELEITDAKVNSFSLVHKSGNQYEGVMDVTVDGERAKLSIDVTYDGKGFVWQVRGL